MSSRQPPKLADKLLSWFCKPELLEEIQGDLQAYFERICQNKGRIRARLQYWLQVLSFIRPFALKKPRASNDIGMLKNHLKIAFRSSFKYKGYTAINLFGLAVGMTVFTIIMLYVQDELSYDQFHEDGNRIFRVVKDKNDSDISHAFVPAALMPTAINEIPEIETGVRLLPWFEGEITYGEKVFYEKKYLYVDSTFFNVFSFPFVEGTAQTALTDPTSIVLTESMSRKYFGDRSPLGKIISFKTKVRRVELKVTGVVKDVPLQSHFTFDFLLPMSGFRLQKWMGTSWSDQGIAPYVYLKLNQVTADIPNKIQKLVDANKKENNYSYSIQQLAGINGIHLNSHLSEELAPNGDKLYIKVLLIIALFIILIAGINYINLATARSSMRAREIGVRKVVGGVRNDLIRQFLTESIVMSIIAGLITIVFVQLTLPFFNSLMQKQLSLFAASSQQIWLICILVVVAIGFLAGLYPAFFLSSFKSIVVLKSQRVALGKGLNLRQALVVFQFGLAALLMVGILVVQNQLSYMLSADVGFDKDRIILIRNVWQMPNRDQNFVVRNAIASLSGVHNITSSYESSDMGAFPNRGWVNKMTIQGSDNAIEIIQKGADHNFIDVFGMELIEGQNLSNPSDEYKANKTGRDDYFMKHGIILNETAVKEFGLDESIVGKKAKIWNTEMPVVGVVKDFHFSSLHTQIRPIFYFWDPDAINFVVKLNAGDIHEIIAQIEGIWKQYAPKSPFQYQFLNSVIEQQYRFEQNLKTLFSVMTALSLAIACLGLYGLAAFTADRRTKEIGIRKVLGAPVRDIVILLSKEFMKLLTIANIIAWPIAWLAMNTWLENFAYRIDIGITSFLLTGVLAIAITIMTVSVQTIKVAVANPVHSLKNE